LPKVNLLGLYSDRINSLISKYININSGLSRPISYNLSTPLFLSNFQELFQKFDKPKCRLLFDVLYFFKVFKIFIETHRFKTPYKNILSSFFINALDIFYKPFFKRNVDIALKIYTKLDQNLLSKYNYQTIRYAKVNFVGSAKAKKKLTEVLISKYNYVHPLLRSTTDNSLKRGIFYYNQTLDNIHLYLNDKLRLANSPSIEYTNTNISKYLKLSDLNSFDVLFLRKSKIFNKGRYSRNRQFYRTGVY
jgi:hypothetical protein